MTRIRLATIAFFVGFLLVGLLVFRDYGISWDEGNTREFGVMNINHVVPNVRALDSLRAEKGRDFERFGPAYEIFLVHVEKALQLKSMRTVFFVRHLLTFLTFYLGVVIFYFFCRRRFAPGITLLACVCLVLSPVLFAHGFYNTKDISFFTVFLAAMSTLDLLLEKPSWRLLALHGITTGLLIGMRVLGFFAVALTVAASLVRRPTLRTVLALLAYGVVISLVLPFVWPVLRVDALGIVQNALVAVSKNEYTATTLFRGRQLLGTELPWDYVPTWMLITTPYAITVLFLAGSVVTVAGLVRHTREFITGARRRDLLVIAWFFLPVGGCVVLRPTLYDGWRHLFFVYPALIYLSAAGMESVLAFTLTRVDGRKHSRVPAALAAALLLSLSPVAWFMVRNHPFEHLYFNRFAGRDMAEAKQRYEFDYWGLSYRRLLEYIVRTDPSPSIRVQIPNLPGVLNSLMLPDADRSRIQFVDPTGEGDYLATNYRFHPEAYPLQEVFSVRVGNAAAGSVFRLR
ncbi:MAG: glycosyltransferase family 39 protein [Gemmatimonadota bacterium]